MQNFSTSALLTFWTRRFLLCVCVSGGCGGVEGWGLGGWGGRLLVHCRLFSNIPDFYPLDARGIFQLQLWQKIGPVKENRWKDSISCDFIYVKLSEKAENRAVVSPGGWEQKWELSENWGTFWGHTTTRCLLRALNHPIAWIYHMLFIHSPFDGHLEYLQLLAFAKNAARNIYMF